MSKRKPRSRRSAAPARTSRSRIGPLWWGAGILALGWIAFDANRPAVERHVPQLAALGLPWEAPETPRARREPGVPRAAAPRPAAPRPASPHVADAERALEPRQAALRPAAAPAVGSAVPQTRPAPALPASAVPSAAAPSSAAPGANLVTRARVPLRRAPRAGAPVWMVLEPGRPLRVTRREGGFARVESGIFTGWVEAAVLPDAHAVPAPHGDRATLAPRGSTPILAPRGTMPTLAAAGAGRTGPVPGASVPGAR